MWETALPTQQGIETDISFPEKMSCPKAFADPTELPLEYARRKNTQTLANPEKQGYAPPSNFTCKEV
jgi:hypothetical protein